MSHPAGGEPGRGLPPPGGDVLGGRIRIEVDDLAFLAQRRGGISRYVANLLLEWRQDPGLGVEALTPWRYVTNELAGEVGLGRSLPAPLRRRRVAEVLNRNPRPSGVPVHHTYYDQGALRGPVRRRVTTVHDMTPELLPELVGGAAPHLSKADHVRAASLVLCVSQTTARDLVDVYGTVDAPIEVTPLGVGAPFAAGPSSAPRRPIEPAFVLFVGRRDAYRGFDDLTEALRLLVDDGDDLHLLAVGGGAFDDRERATLDQRGLSRRVHQRSLDDARLRDAYSTAECLVMPSRYEGFGLPVLEAMASGCPVVVSRAPALLEVAASAARDVPAGDPPALAAAVRALVTDSDERERLVTAGRQRAAGFTWRRTAQATARAYATHLGPWPL